jgi:hypothetical protein
METRKQSLDRIFYNELKEKPGHNSTFAIGGVSCSADSFVVSGTLVFQIKFCGKKPAHRKSAKR